MSISESIAGSGARSRGAGRWLAGELPLKHGFGARSRDWFWASKRLFDIVVSFFGLPIVAGIGVMLLLANPLRNPGPLIFRQTRMGRNGEAITVWKFRTMMVAGEGARGPDDPVESHRVTPLGRWLRRTRIDELPQLYNVLRGEMSVIGPRPDLLDHARTYVRIVPRYRRRLSVRPGISGLAQVRMGYAEGIGLTARKARLDQVYIRNAGWRLELLILRRTFMVMASGFGAR